MGDPLFWLGLSLLLVAVSLTAVLVVAIPAMRELSRAARSAEKLFDTLGRELPPTLEAIRLTGLEITELTDDVNEGVQNAGRVVKQVDEGLSSARQQAKTLHQGTQSLFAGAKAAWSAWSQEGRTCRSTRPKSASLQPAPQRKPHPLQTSPRPRPADSAARASESNRESTLPDHEASAVVDKLGDPEVIRTELQPDPTKAEPDPANRPEPWGVD